MSNCLWSFYQLLKNCSNKVEKIHIILKSYTRKTFNVPFN